MYRSRCKAGQGFKISAPVAVTVAGETTVIEKHFVLFIKEIHGGIVEVGIEADQSFRFAPIDDVASLLPPEKPKPKKRRPAFNGRQFPSQ